MERLREARDDDAVWSHGGSLARCRVIGYAPANKWGGDSGVGRCVDALAGVELAVGGVGEAGDDDAVWSHGWPLARCRVIGHGAAHHTASDGDVGFAVGAGVECVGEAGDGDAVWSHGWPLTPARCPVVRRGAAHHGAVDVGGPAGAPVGVELVVRSRLLRDGAGVGFAVVVECVGEAGDDDAVWSHGWPLAPERRPAVGRGAAHRGASDVGGPVGVELVVRSRSMRDGAGVGFAVVVECVGEAGDDDAVWSHGWPLAPERRPAVGRGAAHRGAREVGGPVGVELIVRSRLVRDGAGVGFAVVWCSAWGRREMATLCGRTVGRCRSRGVPWSDEARRTTAPATWVARRACRSALSSSFDPAWCATERASGSPLWWSAWGRREMTTLCGRTVGRWRPRGVPWSDDARRTTAPATSVARSASSSRLPAPASPGMASCDAARRATGPVTRVSVASVMRSLESSPC